MALSILDGNQTATTLSTILSSGQHITAHTVVSLGTQAITDMRSAVSGSVVSISNLPSTQTIAGTVTAIGVWQDNISPSVVAEGDANPIYGIGIAFSSPNDTKIVGESSPLPVSGFSENEQTFGAIPLVPFDEGVSSGRAIVSKIVNNNGQIEQANPLDIGGTVTANLGSAIPAGTNRIGVVTIGAGTVTLGASTSQIGSVTASISGTVPVSISSVTVGNSITIGSCVTHGVTIANTSVTVNGTFYQATQPVSLTTLPALVAGTAQIGSVTASISGTVPISISSVTIGSCVTHGVTIANTSLTVNGSFFQTTQPVSLTTLPSLVAGTAQVGSVTASISNTAVTVYSAQGTTVTNSNFTSLTSSTSLVSAVAGRKALSVFNEGAGNLHISPNATCTTISYQVRLSSGDYWECPQGQLSLAHTAVFATAGTARITEVS